MEGTDDALLLRWVLDILSTLETYVEVNSGYTEHAYISLDTEL
jgi:hypothetical protein